MSYEDVAADYAAVRKPDPRIAVQIARAVGGGRVINVGAGTGSYEAGVIAAVEPSREMLRHRRSPAPAVRARAEALPLATGCADAATAFLTIHHWRDRAAGLAELQRVARRVVIFTWDPSWARALWLTDYLPEDLVRADAGRFPPVAELLPGARIEPVLIPHDCSDGFMGAYWRRPEAYLSPAVRAGISSLAGVDLDVWPRLAADLSSGAWRARHGAILEWPSIDLGYRLITLH